MRNIFFPYNLIFPFYVHHTKMPMETYSLFNLVHSYFTVNYFTYICLMPTRVKIIYIHEAALSIN